MSKVAELRLDSALRHALGAHVAGFLDEEQVTDLMLNEDGRLWVDRTGRGREETLCTMTAADADAALRLIAHHCGVPLTRTAPLFSATLPRSGERIAATIAPITARPAFAIRKPPAVTFDLATFAPKGPAGSKEPEPIPSRHYDAPDTDGILGALLEAIQERRNILIAGSTGSARRRCCPPCWRCQACRPSAAWSSRTPRRSASRRRITCAC